MFYVVLEDFKQGRYWASHPLVGRKKKNNNNNKKKKETKELG